MELEREERGIVGGVAITIGIILLVCKEYFIGILLTINGILINLGTSWDDKLVNCGLGILCLIGGILFFFFPELISNPTFPYEHYIAGAMFTIIGIYIIFPGKNAD